MFTERAQEIMALAKDFAFSRMRNEIDMPCFLAAVGTDIEARVRLAECLAGGEIVKFCSQFIGVDQPGPYDGDLERAEPLRSILSVAGELASAEGVPDRTHPGMIDLSHMVCAVAMSRKACRLLGASKTLSSARALDLLRTWYETGDVSTSLADLVQEMLALRSNLMTHVFGQEHAIHTFVEGLYNGQVTAPADRERKRPSAIFVFAGPSGVGKTYMAELAASSLKRPFKRFDMTGYSDHHDQNSLVGFAPSYKGAQPGMLTGFVEKHPNAVLLFDEIEKAHLTTNQLFYQMLDAGLLEDKFMEKNVSFRDTVIIFTTNAGRSLYDHPNKIGISAANSSYHKKTILSALEMEKNPADGRPAFPQALCSRLAQGYLLLFNYLSIDDLRRVCEAELVRTGALMERQYFKQVTYDPFVPACLVFREGARADARQVRSEAETFIKGELFKYCSLYKQDKLEDLFDATCEIRFTVDNESKNASTTIEGLFETEEKPKVLLAANEEFAALCRKHISEVTWICTSSPQEVVDTLSTEDIDMVLLDIWLRGNTQGGRSAALGALPPSARMNSETLFEVDFTPLSAKALDAGRAILRKIHQRAPHTPTYILSFEMPDSQGNAPGKRELWVSGHDSIPSVDDELFLACVRAGGARGLVTAPSAGVKESVWANNRNTFVSALMEIHQKLYRERQARALARSRKILTFDSATRLCRHERAIEVRLRNFAIVTAVDGADAGELLDAVERPIIGFDDVIGLKHAKESLRFLIDWLNNSKYYDALGVRAPKGILFNGAPGVGKTMLARALAGESECAFIETSASSFVTIWQGSGPQSVRELFARARRYAPAVVFIDELDAIGTKRSGNVGAGRAQEETLNAMLTEMDGFRENRQHPVIVLAATNLGGRLDDALKRRFDSTIDLDRPDRAARLEYLKRTMQARKHCEVSERTLDRLAGQTALLTIADLERIVQQGAVMAAQAKTPLNDEFLAEAFARFRMGESRIEPAQKRLLRTARHEAGHALIACLEGNTPVQVTIVGRGNAGGFMEPDHDETKGSFTKSEVEQLIRQALGGRVSEILYYGPEGGLDTGAASDLKKASRLATRMVTTWGMTEEFGHLALFGDDPRWEHTGGVLAAEVARISSGIVKAQLDKAHDALAAHRNHLDALVDLLMEKNTLYEEDLEDVLPFVSSEHVDGAKEGGCHKRSVWVADAVDMVL